MAAVALFTDRLLRKHRTGIDRYYDQMVARLPHLAPDWQFTVHSFGEVQQDLTSIAPNVTHQPVPLSRRQLNLRVLSSRPVQTKMWSPYADIIHMLMPLPLRTDRAQTFVTVHDLAPLTVRKAYSWRVQIATALTMRMLAKQNTSFINVSYNTQADLKKLFAVPDARSHMIYEGVTEAYHPVIDAEKMKEVRHRYELPEKFILYIGSLHPRKNLITAVKAYHRYLEMAADPVGMVFAGRYDLGKLEVPVEFSDTLQQIMMPGYIEEDDLPAVISDAQALLYPTLYEGFGLPVLEAMACATPIITSNTSSIRELVTDHTLTCNPYDIDCFANAMEQVVADDKYRQQQIEAGLEHVQQFSWQKSAENLMALYRSSLDSNDTN